MQGPSESPHTRPSRCSKPAPQPQGGRGARGGWRQEDGEEEESPPSPPQVRGGEGGGEEEHNVGQRGLVVTGPTFLSFVSSSSPPSCFDILPGCRLTHYTRHTTPYHTTPYHTIPCTLPHCRLKHRGLVPCRLNNWLTD